MALLSKLRTRQLRTFVGPETNQTRIVQIHKRLVVQLESIECLLVRHDQKDLLSLDVLVDEFCYVAVTSERCWFDMSHEVDGDQLESMLYIVRSLLRSSLLLALTDSTDITGLYVSVVVDSTARHSPQDIHALSIDVSHALVPPIRRFSSHCKSTRATSKVHLEGAQKFACLLLSP